VRGTSRHRISCAPCLKSSRVNGAASARSRTADWACAPRMLTSTLKSASASRNTPPTRVRTASAARSFRANASRISARPLAQSAHRSIRWVRRWSHPRARVPPITAIAGWSQHRSQLMVDFTLSCPLPYVEQETILLAHGGGGKAMHRLLESVFMPAFSNPLLAAAHDGAALNINGARLAFSTDSYVIHSAVF